MTERATRTEVETRVARMGYDDHRFMGYALFGELAKSTGQDARLDRHVGQLRPQLGDLESIQYRARKVAEDICLALQGSLLVRHGHPAVAEAFLATRLEGQWGGAFGTMPAGLDLAPIIERALVKG